MLWPLPNKTRACARTTSRFLDQQESSYDFMLSEEFRTPETNWVYLEWFETWSMSGTWRKMRMYLILRDITYIYILYYYTYIYIYYIYIYRTIDIEIEVSVLVGRQVGTVGLWRTLRLSEAKKKRQMVDLPTFNTGLHQLHLRIGDKYGHRDKTGMITIVYYSQ